MALYDKRYVSPTNPTGLNLFGQNVGDSGVKPLFNTGWDSVMQGPKAIKPLAPAVSAPQSGNNPQDFAAAATAYAAQTSPTYYPQGTTAPGGGDYKHLKTINTITGQSDIPDWQQKYMEEVKAPVKAPPQQYTGPGSNLSYIQLANMLSTGSAAKNGMTDEQVVAAMNAIKGAS